MLSGSTSQDCFENCCIHHHHHDHKECEGGETNWKGYHNIDDCIRQFCPEHLHTDKKEDHKCNEYCIHGVNVLNKTHKEVDHEKRKIEEKKLQHTKVEKRRRVLINQYIEELASLLPPELLSKSAKPPRGLVLQKTVQYIKELKAKQSPKN
ncbi:hypothetical protein CONCODRAFT_77250 [Conidiobolus coronatus NRRL 28638]|uniref:BHLH domain-containing protein n=1 Tax=Conidiobolus coronatus (strain ATCC 28846 / CBS 209.66 / NRRL 28638) TaxID=796925 RepID=A0A137PFB9_CONC2|nr:hypothetical protein CONCODRAFT_77250 [Conidiobolus coronatus NRRL 28638]|eukprot:KXN73697.1 hypothetical protein CONCODRAFT_77250 [Conidiobolus coronatus NRRL 28638]